MRSSLCATSALWRHANVVGLCDAREQIILPARGVSGFIPRLGGRQNRVALRWEGRLLLPVVRLCHGHRLQPLQWRHLRQELRRHV